MKYHIMGVMRGSKSHCIQTVTDKETADNSVACMLAGDTGYTRAWVETESDDRTPLENDVQQEIERDMAD